MERMNTPAGRVEGVVLWTMNEWYAVEIGGVEWRCRLRGALRKTGRAAVLPVVGDQVTVQPSGEGAGIVEAVAPRRSVFSRRAAGGQGGWREQVLAANIDQVLVVVAATLPDPNPRAVDRFLVVAEANELPATLVINKVDLTGEEPLRALFGVYEQAGYPVRYVSATRGDGVEALPALLTGQTTLLAGPSGVGKSSLINTVAPSLHLRTGEVSRSLNKGRHTTVVGALHPLPWGGYVADTPGLRELAPWNIAPDDLSDCFPEMRPYQDACRWPGCRHRAEQDCAVRAAVQEGMIDRGRYDSYLRLLDDALAAEEASGRTARAR